MSQQPATSPESHVHPSPPLTLLQMLLLDCCLLLAVAVLWNRDQLPRWSLPQPSTEFTLSPQQLMLLDGTRIHLYKLEGNEVLLVGDSMLTGHPWRVDTIGWLGMSPVKMLRIMERQLPDRRYELIVLWGGTVPLSITTDMFETYIDPTVAMVRVARAHGDRVVVVGPMPVPRVRGRDGLGNPIINLEATLPTARAALRELHKRLPDQQIIDLEPFLVNAISHRRLRTYYRDGLHLSRAGFKAFHEYLGGQPQPLVMPHRELEDAVTG